MSPTPAIKDPEIYHGRNQYEQDMFFRKCYQVFEIRLVAHRLDTERVQFAAWYITGEVFDAWNRYVEKIPMEREIT